MGQTLSSENSNLKCCVSNENPYQLKVYDEHHKKLCVNCNHSIKDEIRSQWKKDTQNSSSLPVVNQTDSPTTISISSHPSSQLKENDKKDDWIKMLLSNQTQPVTQTDVENRIEKYNCNKVTLKKNLQFSIPGIIECEFMKDTEVFVSKQNGIHYIVLNEGTLLMVNEADIV